MRQATLDVLDCDLRDGYNRYLKYPSDDRFKLFKHNIRIDPFHSQEKLASINQHQFAWKEFKYSAYAHLVERLDQEFTSDKKGIYFFYVRPSQLIHNLPGTVLYVGISERPLKLRIQEYYNIETIRKRENIHKLLQLYYEETYIVYSYLDISDTELSALEVNLHEFYYAFFCRRDFEPETKKAQKAWGTISWRAQMRLPCLRGDLGDWVYYSSLMTAKQISDWVMTSKEIRESRTLDDLLQRDLHERRQQIAQYLLTDTHRFFNSIIIGVFEGVPDWLEFDLSKRMGASLPDNERTYLESSMGIMAFSGHEMMFAIDGQHRVEGIKLALLRDQEFAPADQKLKHDQYSVIFVAHMDDALGKKRTRKLFSDINKNAKPVAKGDKIKIDEQDWCAIVTRRIYAEYRYFDSGSLIALTESERLKDRDEEHFTNLLGIYQAVRILSKLCRKAPKTSEWDEENIQKLKQVSFSFLDWAIEHVQHYRMFFIDHALDLATARKENAYLLFRPVGFVLLAKIYAFFVKKGAIDFLSQHINCIDFTGHGKHFSRILWNRGKMEAKSANQNLAYELSLYLLGQLSESQYSSFKNRYSELTQGLQELPPPVI